MDDETRNALDRWIQTVDKCIREQGELIQKMSSHIIDHQVDLTSIEKRINNIDRRIDHIETYIDPIKDFIEHPVEVGKGAQPDE